MLEGLVVAVGPGARNSSTGAHIPMSVAVGDKVMLPEYGGSKVELESQVSSIIINQNQALYYQYNIMKETKTDGKILFISGIHTLPRS